MGYVAAILVFTNIIVFALLSLHFTVRWYTSKIQPTNVIIDSESKEIFMRQWIIWPKTDTKNNKWGPKRKFELIINQFCCLDKDPPRNHTGWSVSLVIDGIGVEHVYAPVKKEITLAPYTVRLRRPNMSHTIHGDQIIPLTMLVFARLDVSSS